LANRTKLKPLQYRFYIGLLKSMKQWVNVFKSALLGAKEFNEITFSLILSFVRLSTQNQAKNSVTPFIEGF